MTSTKDKKRRQFFLIVATFLVAVAALKFYRGHQPAAIRAVISAGALLLLEFALPKLAAQVFKVWMTFARILGIVNTRILLTIVFFVIITPLSWALKIFGASSFANTKNYLKQNSAWTPLPPIPPGRSSYENSY